MKRMGILYGYTAECPFFMPIQEEVSYYETEKGSFRQYKFG